MGRRGWGVGKGWRVGEGSGGGEKRVEGREGEGGGG